jgi:uncharacterized peroxidase-related enzyme
MEQLSDLRIRGVTMSRLPLLTIDQAPVEVQSSMKFVEDKTGYLPNLLRILANAPVALESYLTVGRINARASLNVAEREAVQITAAATHGCGFCVAGHTVAAYQRAKLDQETVQALRTLQPVTNPRIAAVADFTRAVIRSRGAVTDEELTQFRNAGFGDSAALEVILGVSLATLCNFANNLGQAPLNSELEPYEWSKEELVGA